MKKLNIVSFYKHNIVYKNIKHKNIKTFLYSLVSMIIVGTSFFAVLSAGDFKNVAQTVNPINELYHDVQVATFVSSDVVNFILPVKSSEIENKNDELVISVGDSIMVIAPAGGKIVEAGNKVIKIRHTDSVYSLVSGVNVCGVKVGENVKQGKEIATALQGDKVTISIWENNKKVSGLYVYKSFIKWD